MVWLELRIDALAVDTATVFRTLHSELEGMSFCLS